MEINQTVMLVDLDLRSPSVHNYFGIKAEKGLADYLLNEAELQEMLIHPGIDRLVLLPAGRALPQAFQPRGREAARRDRETAAPPRGAALLEAVCDGEGVRQCCGIS